ncbi:MAG: 2-oxo acid dehydrogenase subunit E2 [Candidatus Tectomicrobia bacterium]|uniref:Dihydrolipoamide acetyltransferase component of pyruvate dehydrogenase complex n=1 Tax=Tectimicrobiota bacterium TaxID=2528274 RepID=A0A932CPU9_UNCTE|nr:2-oxo acid dehydrogenase subunit E2 [Candidatus Tectomicrobia bacterium]
MPKLGMTMTEGRVVEWLAPEGARVEKGATVLRIESDKIEYEVEAPASGLLARIYVVPSEEAWSVGSLLAVVLAEGEVLDEEALAAELPVLSGSALPQFAALSSVSSQASRPRTSGAERIKVSPAARKLAEEKGVDLSRVTGTGPGGRITREDVLAALENPPMTPSPTLPQGPVLGGSIPLSRMRKTIAQRLTASATQVPHIYLFSEIDATGLQALRERLLPGIAEQTGQRLSYNDLLLQAVAQAIQRFPLFHSTLEGETIRIPEEIHIGLAVAVEGGLIVPVVRSVQRKSLEEIVRERADLVQRAQAKRLTPDDLQGGTFTISNLGMYEVDYFTAIINPPQSAILSVGRMAQRPQVVAGQIAVRTMMWLGLSADHRVVDGAQAAEFLQEIKRTLERPMESLS